LGEPDWEALNMGNYGRFSAAEQAALQIADKLTRDSQSVSETDAQPLRQYLSAEQIVDLDVLVGLFNMTVSNNQ